MIEVRGVKATARELRPLQKGWGPVHGFMCAPVLVPFVGLWVLVVLAGDSTPVMTTSGILVLSTLGWFAANHLLSIAMRGAARAAPTASMTNDFLIDDHGLRIEGTIARSSFDWAAVRDVLEEKDRFLFLLTLQSNPALPKRQMTPDQIQSLRALLAEVRASGRLGRGVD